MITMEKLEFNEDENQLETEEDIASPIKRINSEAVLSGNDWTTETIISQINKGNIQLNPSFQRRDAWDLIRKSKFIESLILGLPVPQIVLAESRERRGAYIVLDGKQRLLTLRQFSASETDEIYNQLKLKGLEIRKDLVGFSLDLLKSNLAYFDDQSSFENQPIRTVVIKNWPDENFLYHIFLRLNTGSVPLSPQELRQALHPGAFVSYLDESSSTSNCFKDILKISKPDFRMRDAELLLRYFAFKNYLTDYTGLLKEFLDNTCMKLNRDWALKKQMIIQQAESLELAHSTVKLIFRKNGYRKWSGREYETRFNRAIFDIMSLSMSNSDVRDAVKGKESIVENAFKDLCSTNADFRNSIETTTKSLWATYTRISLWYSQVNEILGTELHVPTLTGNRII